MKKYKVYQTIWAIVDAENESDAVEIARNDESIYDGWTKWETEYVGEIADDIIDFYPYKKGEEDGVK